MYTKYPVVARVLGLGLYTIYPIVARALGLAAECVARAKVSCIQGLGVIIHKGCMQDTFARATHSAARDDRVSWMGKGGNADACVNFACKRPNFTDVGAGW